MPAGTASPMAEPTLASESPRESAAAVNMATCVGDSMPPPNTTLGEPAAAAPRRIGGGCPGLEVGHDEMNRVPSVSIVSVPRTEDW